MDRFSSFWVYSGSLAGGLLRRRRGIRDGAWHLVVE
jgi:hypothetical protein